MLLYALRLCTSAFSSGEDARLFFHTQLRRHHSLIAMLWLASAFGCASPSDQRSTQIARASLDAAPADTDDFGAPLPTNADFSARVVSLNPTATEVIYAIGAEQHLVGRSKWDEFPVQVKSVTSLGDGIRPNIEAVLGAKPTLVILYATAENRPAATALRAAGVRTIALRVDHIAQFIALTQRLGIVLGATSRATQVVDSVQASLERVRVATQGLAAPTVVWPLWQSPVMVVGRGSYLDEIMEIAGARNAFHELAAPSPTVSIEEIAKRDPDFVIVSAKTAARLKDIPAWRAVRAVRDGHLIIDDPALSGRPSVVLGMAANALAQALHPARARGHP